VAVIVRYFNKSAIATAALRDTQCKSGKSPLQLERKTKTRWNSIFYMLARYYKLRTEVISVLVEYEREDLLLNSSQAKMLPELINALQPFEEATVSNLTVISVLTD
jgi:hypothetical protein